MIFVSRSRPFIKIKAAMNSGLALFWVKLGLLTVLAAPGQTLGSPSLASGEVKPGANQPQLLRSGQISVADSHFAFQVMVNYLGELEVQVSLVEERMLLPDSQQLILVGRAIEQRPTTGRTGHQLLEWEDESNIFVSHWFAPSQLGLVERLPFKNCALDTLNVCVKEIIETQLQPEARWFPLVLTGSILKYFSLSGSRFAELIETIQNQQMALYDLEIRLEQIRNSYTSEANPDDLSLGYENLRRGWLDLHHFMLKETNHGLFVSASFDMGLSIGVTKLLTLGGRGVAMGASSVSQTQLGKFIGSSYTKILERSKLSSESLPDWMIQGKNLGKSSLSFVATPLFAAHRSIEGHIMELQSRSRVARFVLRQIGRGFSFYKAGIKDWKYVAGVQLTQVAMEALERPDDLFSFDPIIMSKKMINDRSFLNNVLYMTNETILMAGIENTVGRVSLTRAFAIKAIVGAFDSAFMSLVIKGETKAEKLALDIGWETTIGPVQVAFDKRALQYFDKLSIKKNKPGLNRVGWLLVLADASLGYRGYAKATNLIDPPASSSSGGLRQKSVQFDPSRIADPNATLRTPLTIGMRAPEPLFKNSNELQTLFQKFPNLKFGLVPVLVQ